VVLKNQNKMPIEIKELIIKAIVSDEPEGSMQDKSMNETQKQEIIQTCVDQVLSILKIREER